MTRIIISGFAFLSALFQTLSAQGLVERKLHTKQVVLKELKRPVAVKIIREYNLVIITDGNASLNSPVFFAYTLDSLKFIRSFITLGPGENQVYTTPGIQHVGKQRTAFFFDVNMQRFGEFSLDSVIAPQAKVPIQKFYGRNDPFTRLKGMADYLYATPFLLTGAQTIVDINNDFSPDLKAFGRETNPAGSSSPLTFSHVNNPGKISRTKTPQPIETVLGQDNKHLLPGRLGISGNGDRILFHAYAVNLLVIYDTTGKITAQLQGSPETSTPANQSFPLIPGKMGYLATQTRMYGNRVYAINQSVPVQDKTEKWTALYQFNENLQPLQKLLIRGGGIGFDIDPVTGTIYSLDGSTLWLNWAN